MMVEIAGSGKTTLAKKMALETGAVVVSSDSIREELYGDEATQGDPKEVFRIMEDRTLESLKAGKSVIYDATNVVAWRRMEFLSKLAGDVWKECVWVDTPKARAIRNNLMRKRNVPEWVILRQSEQLEEPTVKEGWDKIIRC